MIIHHLFFSVALRETGGRPVSIKIRWAFHSFENTYEIFQNERILTDF